MLSAVDLHGLICGTFDRYGFMTRLYLAPAIMGAVAVLLHLLNKQVVAVDKARGQSPSNVIGETHHEVRHTWKRCTKGIPVTRVQMHIEEGVRNRIRLMRVSGQQRCTADGALRCYRPVIAA